ncbi:MAG: LAGLIDADG family homing endonuclease, partial [Candidatus Micrarchaeota archaeon]
FELKVYSKYVVDAFKRVFPELARKNTFREVPAAVQKSSPECVAAFVRGAFDAEGSASGGIVSLAMANKRVVQTLQFLLLRFGIISSFSLKKTRIGRQQYYLSVSDGESLKHFVSVIGFSSKKKQAALQEFARVGRRASYCDEPPVDGEFVRRLAATLKMNTKRFVHSPDFIGGRRQVSRKVFSRRVLSVFEERLREIVDADENDFGRLRKSLRIKMSDVAAAVGACTSAILNLEHGKSDYREAEAFDFLKREKRLLESSCRSALRSLQILQDSDFVKAKVTEKKSITPNGLFYDLTVPSTSNFIVNGIVAHNSARRFQRIHEESVEVYYKRIGTAMDAFVGLKNFEGVIVGGPGPSKEDFLKLKPFNYQLKIVGVIDTGYSDEPGLRELLEKSGGIIHEQEAVREKRIFDEFMKSVSTSSGFAVYGLDEVEAALGRRQVKQLLVSEDLKLKRFAYKCNSCGREGERIAEEFEERDCECGGKEEVAEEEDVTQALLDEAERQGVPVEVFSRETQAGSEFHATFRGLGAFLKYK